jgi:xanthine dehydrogenase accessory factor
MRRAPPSTPELYELALRLSRAGEPFVLATVIRAERPTSAKPGAKAIVTAGGEWIGWIGGSCSKPAVEREARRVLASGEPGIVRLSSEETCASGGSLEIYLEPHLPQPSLVVVGHLPVAEALVPLARTLGFRVTVMTLEGNREAFADADEVLDRIDFGAVSKGECYVVVASHGNYDEEGIRAALAGTESRYVALVSSRKRAEAMLSTLGLAEAERSRLKFPAGLDIGASTPGEIALSILAEIVKLRRREKKVAEETALAKDPVCGMAVEIATARHVLERDGASYYFCCAGCKERFAHAS